MTLRAIMVDAVQPRDGGARPELAWLALRQLVIDEDYQRPLGEKNWTRIRAIAAAFDWRQFAPVLVAPVDPALGPGLFAVIDGQHRCHAALLAGQAEVPALIVAADRAAQAAGFVAVNVQATRVSVFHTLRAGLAAGEPQALAMRAAVAAAGAQLMTGQTSAVLRKPGQVFAVGLIRGHVAAGRAAVVTAGLAALVAARCGRNRGCWDDAFLAPWLAALAADPVARQAGGLAGFLDAQDWDRVRLGATRLRSQPGYARKSVQAITAMLMGEMLQRWQAGAVAGQVAA